MSKSSLRSMRAMGTGAFQTSQGLINQLTEYTKRPLPVFREEEAQGYLSEPEKLAGQVIREILEGNLYNQPGVKSRFAGAIETPIMNVLNERVMPQIAASAGKGGTYFSTMRGEEEIEATQAAADKIAELEGGFILNAMGEAIPQSLAYGNLVQERWKRMQPEWGGGTVPLIQETLKSAIPQGEAGLTAAEQVEAIKSQERQARMAGITSGFGSAMGAGGQIGGAAAGKSGCCFLFIEGQGDVTDQVQKFKHAHYPYNSDVANGYRWMSIRLMPYVTKNKFFKKLVKHLITSPLSKFAKYYYEKNSKGLIYAPAGIFWNITWALLGRLGKYNSDEYQRMVLAT